MKRPIDRRTFLNRSAWSVAAAAAAWQMNSHLGSAARAAVTAHKKFPRAIMWGTVGLKGTILEKFRAIKAAGFDGVEPMSHMNVKEVLQGREETGLVAASVCCSTHWDKPLSHPDPKVRQEGLDGLKQALRDAKEYGASSVLLVPAVVSKQVSYDDAYKRSQEEIHKVLPLAAELKVKVAIENVWNQFLLSPLEAARYIDEFQNPWIGWHFDVGNIINYGWPEQWIRILKHRIVKLHIKEFSRQRRDKEGLWKGFDVAYLEGDNDWPAILKALQEIGFSGWAIAEPPGVNTPEKLLDIRVRMDKIFDSAA